MWSMGRGVSRMGSAVLILVSSQKLSGMKLRDINCNSVSYQSNCLLLCQPSVRVIHESVSAARLRRCGSGRQLHPRRRAPVYQSTGGHRAHQGVGGALPDHLVATHRAARRADGRGHQTGSDHSGDVWPGRRGAGDVGGQPAVADRAPGSRGGRAAHGHADARQFACALSGDHREPAVGQCSGNVGGVVVGACRRGGADRGRAAQGAAPASVERVEDLRVGACWTSVGAEVERGTTQGAGPGDHGLARAEFDYPTHLRRSVRSGQGQSTGVAGAGQSRGSDRGRGRRIGRGRGVVGGSQPRPASGCGADYWRGVGQSAHDRVHGTAAGFALDTGVFLGWRPPDRPRRGYRGQATLPQVLCRTQDLQPA